MQYVLHKVVSPHFKLTFHCMGRLSTVCITFMFFSYIEGFSYIIVTYTTSRYHSIYICISILHIICLVWTVLGLILYLVFRALLQVKCFNLIQYNFEQFSVMYALHFPWCYIHSLQSLIYFISQCVIDNFPSQICSTSQ